MLYLFFKIIFPSYSTAGDNQLFLYSQNGFIYSSVCSILNNPFDSHAGLSPFHQAGISWACKHKRDVPVAPGASKGASLKTPSEEGSTNPLHQKCHRRWAKQVKGLENSLLHHAYFWQMHNSLWHTSKLPFHHWLSQRMKPVVLWGKVTVKKINNSGSLMALRW